MMTVKKFPEDMAQFAIDPSNTKKCLVHGFFQEEVEVQGSKRTFYTYITEGLLYNQPCLVIAPPEDVSVPEWAETGFWKEFAEKHQVFLHFLEPQNGQWNLDGSDADYMNRVYVQAQSRQFYVTMQDNFYAFGFGKGATVAQQAVMKMTSEWSGLATFGDLEEAALLNCGATQQAEQQGKVELAISAQKAQIPVWMSWTENKGYNQEVCAYWKQQNHCTDAVYSGQGADEIYFPTEVYKKSAVNEEQISQVRVTNGFCGCLEQNVFETVWTYVGAARRHRCFGMKALRSYKKPEAYGAERKTLEVDGFTRLWYEYVPEAVKKEGKPVPLVVCMHGRGGSAESFFDLSGMSCVAEERGFILLIPEASISQQKKNGIQNLLLWNGAYQGKEIDDTRFVLKMIDDVKSRYAIDEERIYACGQSSGGMMTSALALRAPQVFAAVSPWSALKSPDREVPLPERIDPSVPYLFLLGENDWLCVDKEHGEQEYHVRHDIAAFLTKLMDLYKLDKNPARYQCGEIQYYVYCNQRGTPMLKVGVVKDMSHANYPRESWIAYDEFFSKFSKKADGTLLYMGKDAI